MTKSNYKKVGTRYSALSNLFLNILIFVFSVIIIYMGYSIFLKLRNPKQAAFQNQPKNKPAEIIQAEVLNGCGVSGLAERFTDYLRLNKVDVVKEGDYSSFDVPETLVIDRRGNKANALEIAKILGVKKNNVIQQIDENLLLDVSVIIGKDYFKLKPVK